MAEANLSGHPSANPQPTNLDPDQVRGLADSVFATLLEHFSSFQNSAAVEKEGTARRFSPKWVVYHDIYVQALEARCGESDHAAHVRGVLERFTRYRKLDNKDLSAVSQLDLEMYVSARLKDSNKQGKPLSARTINNEIEILNTCFSKAGPKEKRGRGRKNFGYLEDPPWLEKLQVYRREVKTVETWQIADFVRATAKATSPRIEGCTPQQFWLAALLLGMVTGLRRKALLKVPRPDDQTLIQKGELFLPAELNKTKADLRMSLGNEEVVMLLTSLPSRVGEPLLPWKKPNGRPMTAGHFSNTLSKFQDDAGIPRESRVTPQKLRATAATEVADVFSDAVAKKKLGHSPYTNTLDTNYKRLTPTDIDRQASDHLAKIILPHFANGGNDQGEKNR